MTSKPLLRQNSELRKDNIFNFSLPAWVTTLPDGSNFNVCQQAGACAKVCYALNGTYRFPAVKAAHQRNLLLARDEEEEFVSQLIAELSAKKFRPKNQPRDLGLESHDHLTPTIQDLLTHGAAAVRIHDGGDFFSDSYLEAWLEIARTYDDIIFYAYTKEVTRFRRAMDVPDNFLIVYSLGGKEDHLLDLEVDQHADVFPTKEALEEASYFDQETNDLLCVLAPSNKIGIVANSIPSFRKRQGEDTFGGMEAKLTRHSRGQSQA